MTAAESSSSRTAVPTREALSASTNSSRWKVKGSPLSVKVSSAPSPTHCAPGKKVSKDWRKAVWSGAVPRRWTGRARSASSTLRMSSFSGRDTELSPCVPEERLEGTGPRVPGSGEAFELGDVDALVNVFVRMTVIAVNAVRVRGADVFAQAKPRAQGLLRDLGHMGKFLEREVRPVLLVERHQEATEFVRVGAALLLRDDAPRVFQKEREQPRLELLAAG